MPADDIVSTADNRRVLLSGNKITIFYYMLLAQILQQKRSSHGGRRFLPDGMDGEDRFMDTPKGVFQVG
jgi:hypothetical protein